MDILISHNLSPRDIPYYHEVPCGKCIACRLQHGRKWSARLLETLNNSFNNYFLTLTYSDDDLIKLFNIGDNIPELNPDHLDDFLNRIKVKLRAAHEKQLRHSGCDTKIAHKLSKYPKYYAVGDYGETTFRPHYHVLLFNCVISHEELYQLVYDTFDYGLLHDVRPMLPEHCSYAVKYVATYSPQFKYAVDNNLELPFYRSSRGLIPDNQRLSNLAVEYDSGNRTLQHGRAHYGYPAYVKHLLNKYRYLDIDDNMYDAYSQLVKDSSLPQSFLDENDYLLRKKPDFLLSESEIKQKEYKLLKQLKL